MPPAFITTAVLLAGLAAAVPTKSIWQPLPGTKWQTSLSQTCNTTDIANAKDVDVFDIDLFTNSADVISELHAAGKKVICYFSAGSYEPWVPDAGDFLDSDKGSDLDGWPGEVWLQTGSSNVRSIMTKRIALAAQKGCDAVDPDNVDGYDNNNGLSLTKATGIDYVKFLADTAAAQGLACSLKNAGGIIPDVISKIQFSVNEQCHQYSECDLFSAFIKAGKPVFNIEYPGSISGYNAAATTNANCNAAKTGSLGFSTILKNMILDWPAQFCPQNSAYLGGSTTVAAAEAAAAAAAAAASKSAVAAAASKSAVAAAASKSAVAVAASKSAAAAAASKSAAQAKPISTQKPKITTTKVTPAVIKTIALTHTTIPIAYHTPAPAKPKSASKVVPVSLLKSATKPAVPGVTSKPRAAALSAFASVVTSATPATAVPANVAGNGGDDSSDSPSDVDDSDSDADSDDSDSEDEGDDAPNGTAVSTPGSSSSSAPDSSASTSISSIPGSSASTSNSVSSSSSAKAHHHWWFGIFHRRS